MTKKVELNVTYERPHLYQLNVETEYCSFYVDLSLDDLEELAFRCSTLIQDEQMENGG